VDLPEDTVAELQALAGVALAYDDLSDALARICQIAARAVRHADGATMTTFGLAGPEVAAASDDWASDLDELQHEEREGPCIDGARTGVMFRVRDFGEETRWPSYVPRARKAGAVSMLSIPMNVESKTIGALNVYSRQVDAFGAEEIAVAEVIAGHASLATQVAAALHSQRFLAEQLRTAMASRAGIEQAKGIIMGSVGCDPDTAFKHLVLQSQHENRKVREIAEELVRQQDRQR
jgi:GAF domain-containing protein